MYRKLITALLVALLGSAAFAASLSLTDGAPAPLRAEEIAGRPLGDLTYRAMTDPEFAERVRHFLADHGLDHPKKADLGGASAIEVAQRTLNAEPRNGRTVSEWVSFAKAENLLSLRPETGEKRVLDLADEIARLDAAVGVTLAPHEIDALRAQAAALPADVREPFAALVAAVADVYVAQTPIANAIVARISDTSVPLAFAPTEAEREATLANALALVAAQNAFRAAVEDVEFPATTTPLVSDPAGLVYLGSIGSDTYQRTGVFRDPVLLVDPAGDDTYHTTGGSACPDAAWLVHDCNGLVVSVAVDLLGSDTYTYTGRPTNVDGSASFGGIGLLVDVEGNDSYYAHFIQPFDLGPFWGGVLGYIDAGAQGYGLAAVGIQIDATGDDVYEADVSSADASIWGLSQGFGNAGGVGIMADATGDDDWLAYGFDIGIAGFQGLYPGGTGFFGGVGIITETGLGNDDYHAWDDAVTTDFYAYGFGAFGGTGIFYDDGGDDNYDAVESASNPWINPLLNCAFGTASFAGLGVFLEMGGNDRYFGDTRTPRTPWTMNEGFGGPVEGEGLFLDVSGDDGHFMEAHSGATLVYGRTAGRGILLGGGVGLTGNTAGLYLDLEGADVYTGAAPSRNNAVWPFGLDLEAGMVPEYFVRP